jgi:hypothetical protein
VDSFPFNSMIRINGGPVHPTSALLIYCLVSWCDTNCLVSVSIVLFNTLSVVLLSVDLLSWPDALSVVVYCLTTSGPIPFIVYCTVVLSTIVYCLNLSVVYLTASLSDCAIVYCLLSVVIVWCLLSVDLC